jgi:hypothetical protein
MTSCACLMEASDVLSKKGRGKGAIRANSPESQRIIAEIGVKGHVWSMTSIT